MSSVDTEAMYRLLAIAEYPERYVIPATHRENAAALEGIETGCSLDVPSGPEMGDGKVLLPLSVVPPEDELPDFLPMVCEFAGVEGHRGEVALRQHRQGIELIRTALRHNSSH